MNPNQDNDDDFILVLGTSPDPNLNLDKYGNVINNELQRSQIEDAMKDLPKEAKLGVKTHFHSGETPSPTSLSVARALITNDGSIVDHQKRFAELLDENMVLKEALKQNNESMKEQFTLLSSCQEDILNTHKLHREKFDETRELVEKLRKENKNLKMDIMRQSMAEPTITNSETGESKSGPSSGVEFVSSPEDDTIDKLTAQLDLVEKQRRQLVVENEKLSWQKESLEHIVDATSKDRDDLKEKLKEAELRLEDKEAKHAQEVQSLHLEARHLRKEETRLNAALNAEKEMEKKIQEGLKGQLASVETELKNAQIKIMDLENIKSEFAKYKVTMSETIKMYKVQIQELTNRIKQIQTKIVQPVCLSVGAEAQASSEYTACMKNVALYDKALKHLADYLNGLANGLLESLVNTFGVIKALQDQTTQKSQMDAVRSGLGDVKRILDKQHIEAVSFIANIHGTMSIFEGIFKDYNEALKKSLSKTIEKPPAVEQLTTALLARGQEISVLQAQLKQMQVNKEETELLRAQAELYKSDFEAERESREKMACEKDMIQTDLRCAQRRIQDLTELLADAAKETSPVKKTPLKRLTDRTPPTSSGKSGSAVHGQTVQNGSGKVFTCPKCCKFSSTKYAAMEEHFDSCLDD